MKSPETINHITFQYFSLVINFKNYTQYYSERMHVKINLIKLFISDVLIITDMFVFLRLYFIKCIQCDKYFISISVKQKTFTDEPVLRIFIWLYLSQDDTYIHIFIFIHVCFFSVIIIRKKIIVINNKTTTSKKTNQGEKKERNAE